MAKRQGCYAGELVAVAVAAVIFAPRHFIGVLAQMCAANPMMNAEFGATDAGASLSTIRDFEKGRRTPIGNNLAAIHRVIETAGINLLFSEDQRATGITFGDARGAKITPPWGSEPGQRAESGDRGRYGIPCHC